jgi:transcription antitermination factor NusG
MINWYVLTYAYRQEETVRQLIDSMQCRRRVEDWNIRLWVPRLKYREIRDGEVKLHDIRMFPGYAFIGLSEDFASRGKFERFLLTMEKETTAFRILKVLCKDGIRRFYRLDPMDIQIVVAKQKTGIKPQKSDLEVGEPVEIAGGLFDGSRGIVQRLKDGEVFVSTHFMGTTAMVKIDRKSLKRLGVKSLYDYQQMLKDLTWGAMKGKIETICTGTNG